MKGTNRFHELDAFRGLAALGVLLYHYSVRFEKLYPYTFHNDFDFNFGYLGVEWFFIISGFVIYYTISKTDTPILFLGKRFIRLYPTYWLCLLFSFFITNYFELPGRTTSLKELIINLSMIQYGLQVRSVDGVYWSLFYEITFYILMAAVFPIIKRDKLHLYAIIWMLLYVTNLIWHTKYVSGILNLQYGPLFLSGMYFYKLTTRSLRPIYYVVPIILLILYLIPNDNLTEKIILISVYALFYLFTFKRLGFISWKPLLFLGNISYALYLIHQNLGYIMLRSLYDAFGNHQILMIVPISCSIIIAYIITMYLEKPIMVRLNSILYDFSVNKTFKIFGAKRITNE